MIVAEVFAIIREMSAVGSIVLLVEQNVHEALSVCGRFFVLERGTVVLAGDGNSEEERRALLRELAV